MELDKIENIIEKLKIKVRTKKFTSKNITKFIFVCGEKILNDSGIIKNREELEKEKNKRQFIINNIQSNNVICIIAEKIYYNSNLDVDILSFEELLAELSDDILIIVESPGTYCELGAFTVNDKNFKKLVVINEKKYENERSFINEGPVKKLLSFSEDRYISTEYEYDKFISDFRIKDYIKRIKHKKVTFTPNKNENKLILKDFIHEILSIIDIFQPMESYEIFYIYKELKGFTEYNIENRYVHKINTPKQILGLLESMDLIETNGNYVRIKGNHTYYDELFNISKEYYNNLRILVTQEIMKLFPIRIYEDKNDVITVNE